MRRLFWPKVAVTLVLTLFSIFASAQSSFSWYESFTDSLTKAGIDTIVDYQPWDNPLGMEATDSLIVHERHYLLWNRNGNLYICQRYFYMNAYIEKLGDSTKLLILQDTLDLFEYLHDHFQEVVNDTLPYPRIRTVKDGKEEIWDVSPADVRDDSYTRVSIMVRGKEYYNGYRGEQLYDGNIRNTDGSLRERRENLNYETNLNKAIHHFIEKLENEVTVFGKF